MSRAPMSNLSNPVNTLVLDETLNTLLKDYLHQHITPTIAIKPEQLAYRWVGGRTGTLQPIAINSQLNLDYLLGIDIQKDQIVQNTQQFIAGYPANHVLMTGTRGSGKSSMIRALLNTYHPDGLRMIEVARDDLQNLDKIRHAIAAVKPSNSTDKDGSTDNDCSVDNDGRADNDSSHEIMHQNRYIIYCDDLAFDAQDENYRTLKSVLDGALDSEQEQLLVYATSNRRHLLPQLMKDNVSIYDGQTDEVNPYETIDETVSLSDRFGLWVSFYPMNQATYLMIAQHYIENAGLSWNEDVSRQALQWSSSRGGRSGRVAYQFSRHWVGQQRLNHQLASSVY